MPENDNAPLGKGQAGRCLGQERIALSRHRTAPSVDSYMLKQAEKWTNLIVTLQLIPFDMRITLKSLD